MTAGPAQILNASTTAAGGSAEVKVRAGEVVTFMVTDALPGVGEEIDIEFKDPSGNWLDLYQGGSQILLGPDDTMAAVYGPGTFRANKDTTSVSAIGVGVARGNMTL